MAYWGQIFFLFLVDNIFCRMWATEILVNPKNILLGYPAFLIGIFMEKPLLHLIFITIILLCIFISLMMYVFAILGKEEKWRKYSYFFLILSGFAALGVATTGLLAALNVDFQSYETKSYIYFHLLSGSVTTVFATVVAWIAQRQLFKSSVSEVKMISLIVVLMACIFCTLSIGKNVLESHAVDHKEKAIFGSRGMP